MKIFGKVSYCLLFALMCCKTSYNPPSVSSPDSYLVVEGVINSGNDSTKIKLSKTVKLNSRSIMSPVLGAVVMVESNNGNNFTLVDVNNNGNYNSAPLNLSASQTYRLKINTNDGNQYVSDFMAVKLTPPIDSIGYTIQNGIMLLYINTHDPSNNTRYYRWDYDETWLFHSKYESEYVLDTSTNTIQPRIASQGVYYCFANDVSSSILLNSTTKLSQDVVYQSPLTHIPITSEKLEKKYSILVKQYALTDDAYKFYQNLKTNTEQLGSIFDAQPNQLNGNIHNVKNPNMQVIGYLTVTNVQSKRIFITNDALPKYTVTVYPYDCEEDSALYVNKYNFNDVQNVLINRPVTDIPTFAIFGFGGIIGYGYSTPPCVDCTLRGSKQQPSFWK